MKNISGWPVRNIFNHSFILLLCFPLQHYASIMKYISQPPLLLDVHIHKPLLPARTWMDSLLAFFPGLQVWSYQVAQHLLWSDHCPNHTLFSQVLKGDIRPAIETHEMLYQVTKKHNFLPEVSNLINSVESIYSNHTDSYICVSAGLHHWF